MKSTRTAAKVKGRHLTLIEVLIVLTIVAMLGGLVAFNIRGPLNDQHFKNDVQKVIERIRLGQQLMHLAPADVEIAFLGNKMTFKSDDKMDPKIDRMIRKEVTLEYIELVTLEQQPNPTLLFKSRGSIVSQGTLTLKGINGDTRQIILSGSSASTKTKSTEKEILSWDPLIEVTRVEITPPPSNPA